VFTVSWPALAYIYMHNRSLAMQKPYRHFDLPINHLATGSPQFVPPQARSRSEIARRRERPAGALINEYQLHGLRIASEVLRQVDSEEDTGFAVRVISAAGVNSAWHTFPPGNVMRRRLALPNMIGEDGIEPPTPLEHLQTARQGLVEATIAAEGLVLAAGEHSTTSKRRRMALGRQIGEASLTLSCSELATVLPLDASEYEIQSLTRRFSLETLEGARTVAHEIGSAPTLAQFADPDSDLSVMFRRAAPNAAYKAFEAATSCYAIAA
jgi:hypothetical protein